MCPIKDSLFNLDQMSNSALQRKYLEISLCTNRGGGMGLGTGRGGR